MRIAIAGATGTVGRHVARVAEQRGHEVVGLSRSLGIDLVSGNGLEEILRAVDVVIDVLGIQSTSTARSVDFFRTTSANLLAAEKVAGVRHHIALSIVGIDPIDSGYYAGKLEQERVVSAGDLPWTILRATQFHEFAELMLRRTSIGPVVLMPVATLRPIAAAEVASALVHLAEGEPRGRVADLGGPRVESLVDMVRRYVRASGTRKPVIPLRAPGALFSAMRRGALLPGAGATLGSQTFDEWLEERTRAGRLAGPDRAGDRPV
ncbi:MAG: NAD-dependent epimerase/dehydratase [Microbacteriaceae bacterium]|nr:NAD-dependent epimerase/dehydratase [Microbacteriaceae bacterium]